ncbi:hypothetical protein K438DRAFT_2012498 [Mycena galopus ATCC 62051]|nr:hypothetical protein K438DRAFT_2012498 [Mycena galopus ATCC 62051]
MPPTKELDHFPLPLLFFSGVRLCSDFTNHGDDLGQLRLVNLESLVGFSSYSFPRLALKGPHQPFLAMCKRSGFRSHLEELFIAEIGDYPNANGDGMHLFVAAIFLAAILQVPSGPTTPRNLVPQLRRFGCVSQLVSRVEYITVFAHPDGDEALYRAALVHAVLSPTARGGSPTSLPAHCILTNGQADRRSRHLPDRESAYAASLKDIVSLIRTLPVKLPPTLHRM